MDPHLLRHDHATAVFSIIRVGGPVTLEGAMRATRRAIAAYQSLTQTDIG